MDPVKVRDQLVGSWSLTHMEKDGREWRIYGERPRGTLRYTPGGQVSVTILSTGKPIRFVELLYKPWLWLSLLGTFSRHMSYCGTYEVVAPDQIVHRVEASNIATWIGTAQPRGLEVSGGRLVLTQTVKRSTRRMHWQRDA